MFSSLVRRALRLGIRLAGAIAQALQRPLTLAPSRAAETVSEDEDFTARVPLIVHNSSAPKKRPARRPDSYG